MKSSSKYLIVAIVICAIILVGELYAYIPVDRYDSKITVVGDDVNYEVSSSRPVQYSVVLLDNGGYSTVDTLYIYKDPEYKICMTDSEHQYYLDKLEIVLKVKGFTNIRYVNTDELYSLFDGPAFGKGLLMSTGAIPVISDSPDSDIGKMLNWINNGGSLYWTYGIIGKQLSYHDRLVESSYYNLLINEGVTFSDGGIGSYEDQYGARSIFSMEQSDLNNAPNRNTVSQKASYYGFNDGKSYAVTSIEKGNGQICIFSGCTSNTDSRQMRDLATVVGSGLSCFTDMSKMKSDGGSFNNTLKGTFDIAGCGDNVVVYVNLGGNYSVYSARHVVR